MNIITGIINKSYIPELLYITTAKLTLIFNVEMTDRKEFLSVKVHLLQLNHRDSLPTE